MLFAADLNAIVQQVAANTAALANGPERTFRATLSGAQEVTDPPGGVDTTATGTITAEFDEGLTQVQVQLNVSGFATTVTAAHFHCAFAGDNGPVALGLFNPGPCTFDATAGTLTCTLTNADFQQADCLPEIGRPVTNIASLFFAMDEGGIYANVHTEAFPAGEIRGQMLD
ncbi:MAG: CHRD domain-containing protein [Candidatus Tectimicrobiota bacterium]|nr:MAG: CHRD domain-containing protein [Candidatus Tectomicrobia bacterium]